MRARLQPLFPNHIVNDFTFEGIHRLQVIRLAGIPHCVNGIQGDITEVLTLALQETVDIHNQMRTLAGLLLYSQTSQLLQSINDFTITANKMFDVSIVISNDLHGGAVITHAHLNVTLIVGDIQ